VAFWCGGKYKNKCMSEENNPGKDLGIEHKFPSPDEQNRDIQNSPLPLPDGRQARGELDAEAEQQGEPARPSVERKEKTPESREEILASLDFTLAWLAESIKKAQTEEEKNRLQWILDSAQNSLKESREAYDGKYEVKSGENVQREGASVDDLLEWLGVEISALTQEGKAEVVEKLERARQILEQNKQSYWRAHFDKELSEINWDEATKQKQDWRTEYEAGLISRDWRATGNQDSDYKKAEDAMAKRQELILPVLSGQEEETEIKPQKQAQEEETIKVQERPEETPTESREEGPKKEKVVFANVSAMIEAAAWDAANAKMTEGKEKLGGAKGFFNKIKNIGKRLWKYNWAYETYRRNEYEKAKKRIYRDYKEGRIDIDKLNILAAEDETSRQEKHHEAMGAMFDRFASEYDEAVEGEAGEEKKKIEDESIKREIRELIRDYAEGSISEGDLARKHNEILGKVAGPDVDVKLEVDNLLEIAERIKRLDGHNRAREALELDLEIIRGRARGGIKTEAGLGRLDRIIDKMKKMRGLSWINETTLAVGATAVYCIGRAISKRFAYSKAANIALFGGTAALSGAYAGILENKRVKEERAQHARERAKGKTFAPEARRRQEMEKFRYETAEAKTILQELQNNYDVYEIKGKRKLKDLSGEELGQALGNLADLEARLSLSNAHKIDLIQYSAPAEVETERTKLLLLRSRIKADLEGKYPAGFKIKGKNQNLDDLVNISKAELTQGKDEAEGISKKDDEFDKMKAKRVAKRVAQAAVTGLILGATFQEIQAAMDDNTQSLLEGILDKNTDAGHQTALEGLRDWITPQKGEGAAQELSKIMIAGHEVQVGLPKGAELKDPNGDGVYSLFYHNKELCDKVSFDEKGNLTNEARAALASRGVHITETLPEGGAKEALAGVSTPEGRMTFVEKYSELFKKITHEMWYDNNTPKPIFDHNELRLDWGGENGLGINENGDYVYSIQRMTADGSWHKEFSVDAHEAAGRGGLSLLLSASHDTEQYVIPIKIDQDFNAIIPKDSEAARMLFTQDAKGQADYLGDHAEVSQMMGKTNTEGAEWIRVLATDSGKNAPVIPEPVEPVPIPIFEIPPQTDLPPVIPILGRKPMEKMARQEKPIIPLYPYPYYGSGSAENILREFESRGIKTDPYIVEMQDRKRVLKKENGEKIERIIERENKHIQDYLESLSPEHRKELEELDSGLPPMEKECRIAIIIPARFEGKNLSNLLDQYTKQVDADGNELNPNLFEVNVIINKKNSEQWDESMDIVQDWKRKNPNIKVNVIQKSFDDDKGCVGIARKYITDLSLLRSLKRKEQDGSLYIESEDADLFSIDKRTVSKLIRDFDHSPEIDVLRGVQDRQPEILMENDLLFFQRRLSDFMEAFLRDRKYRPESNPESDFVWHRVVSGGWNTAYTAEAYSQIGGYNEKMVIGEDMDIGQKISVLRGKKDAGSGDFIPNTWTARASGLRANSSPRRFIDALKRKISPYEDFENQSLKGKTLDELMESIKNYEKASDSQTKDYQDTINFAADFVKATFKNNKQGWQRVMKRALSAMGLRDQKDYVFRETNIELDSEGMKTIIKKLDDYKQERRWKLGYRRQTREAESNTGRVPF